MFYWLGDLLDALNGRRYKTGKEFPRPTLLDVAKAYGRDLTKKDDDKQKTDDRQH